MSERRVEYEVEKQTSEELTQETTAIALPATIALPEKARVDEALDRAIYIASKLVETARQAGMTFTVTDPSGRERESLTTDGWRLLASWCGFGVICEVTERIYDDNGELIRVHARARLVRHGEVFGQADGTCERNEVLRRRSGQEFARWETASDDTLESVAQSRAVAEVCKQNLGFILRLAGFGKANGEKVTTVQQVPEQLTQKDWARFWVRVKELGFEREEVHRLYGVESMKEVIKSKEDIERVIAELEALIK